MSVQDEMSAMSAHPHVCVSVQGEMSAMSAQPHESVCVCPCEMCAMSDQPKIYKSINLIS